MKLTKRQLRKLIREAIRVDSQGRPLPDPEGYELTNLLMSPKADPDLLDKHSKSEDEYNRVAVASNPNTRIETIVSMIENENESSDLVFNALKKRPNLPRYVKRALSLKGARRSFFRKKETVPKKRFDRLGLSDPSKSYKRAIAVMKKAVEMEDKPQMRSNVRNFKNAIMKSMTDLSASAKEKDVKAYLDSVAEDLGYVHFELIPAGELQAYIEQDIILGRLGDPDVGGVSPMSSEYQGKKDKLVKATARKEKMTRRAFGALLVAAVPLAFKATNLGLDLLDTQIEIDIRIQGKRFDVRVPKKLVDRVKNPSKFETDEASAKQDLIDWITSNVKIYRDFGEDITIDKSLL